MMSAHFAATAIKFLRGLTRSNDRAWFEARRPVFEKELKAPMLAVTATLVSRTIEPLPI